MFLNNSRTVIYKHWYCFWLNYLFGENQHLMHVNCSSNAEQCDSVPCQHITITRTSSWLSCEDKPCATEGQIASLAAPDAFHKGASHPHCQLAEALPAERELRVLQWDWIHSGQCVVCPPLQTHAPQCKGACVSLKQDCGTCELLLKAVPQISSPRCKARLKLAVVVPHFTEFFSLF